MGKLSDALMQHTEPKRMTGATRMSQALLDSSTEPTGMGYMGPREFTPGARAKMRAPTFDDLRKGAEIAEASQIPGVSDAASGVMAFDEARKGNWGDAGLNALGLIPFVPALGTKFVRRSQSLASPFNDVPYGMFARADDVEEGLDRLASYGPGKWVADDEGGEYVGNFLKDFTRAIRRSGAHQDYGTTAAALAREANPSDIVNSAGLWDSPDLVEILYGEVLGPKGINKVLTDDGAIIFDESLATVYKAGR